MQEHYMIRETREGPKAIERTIEENLEVVKTLAAELKEKKTTGIIIGSGTSFHASVALAYLLTKYTKYHFEPVPASEFEEWVPKAWKEYLMIAFSQSGESSDVIKAVDEAKKVGSYVLGITNTPGSTLTKLSDFALVTRAGEEKAVTATKTYDAQLAIGSLLAYELSDLPEASKLKEELRKVPDIVEKVLAKEDSIKAIAEKYKDAEHVFVLGHGPNYANALEGALKLKEAAMIHAEGFAVREFLHGPVQLVDESTPVILLVPTEKSLEGSEKTIKKLLSYKPPIIAIAGEKVEVDFASDVIRIPDVVDELSIFPVVKAIQLFAYYISIARGLNPDKPTKLTKVVKYEEEKTK